MFRWLSSAAAGFRAGRSPTPSRRTWGELWRAGARRCGAGATRESWRGSRAAPRRGGRLPPRGEPWEDLLELLEGRFEIDPPVRALVRRAGTAEEAAALACEARVA